MQEFVVVPLWVWTESALCRDGPGSLRLRTHEAHSEC